MENKSVEEVVKELRTWACNYHGEFFKRYSSDSEEKKKLWFTADEVEKIIEHTIQQERQTSQEREREIVTYESILPTWIDGEPAWTLVVVKENHIVWVSEKPVKQSIIASAYYQETRNYAMPVITVGEVALGTKHIYEQNLTNPNKD